MSAVNPSRLAMEVEELGDLVTDPAALRRACLNLLDFYADRTQRSGSSTVKRSASKAFHVPRPVVRALSIKLKALTQAKPDIAWPAASALWEAGYREMRALAIAILNVQTDPSVPQMAEVWASNCSDHTLQAMLSGTGLEGWRRADSAKFLTQVEAWSNATENRIRVFALLSLHAAVDDPNFEDLPTVFQLCEGLAGKVRGEERRALYALVTALAHRSPPEAARFLTDELARGDAGARRMIENTLSAFPRRQRELLQRTLSA
jgi:hypothetical protein